MPSPSKLRVNIRKITPRTREIMFRQIRGDTNIQIARDMRLTPVRVSMIVNSPLYIQEYNRFMAQVETKAIEKLSNIRRESDDVVAILDAGKTRAATALIEAVENESGRTRLMAAKDILDRTGHTAVARVEMGTTLRLPDEQLKAIQEALAEAGLGMQEERKHSETTEAYKAARGAFRPMQGLM